MLHFLIKAVLLYYGFRAIFGILIFGILVLIFVILVILCFLNDLFKKITNRKEKKKNE